MEAINSSLVERRPQATHQRKDSESTIASSAAAYISKSRQHDLTSALQVSPTTQTSMQFARNENVHLGPSIHHHYYNAPPDVGENSPKRGDSFASSESEDFSMSRERVGFCKLKKTLAIVASAIFLIAAIATVASITYVLLASDNSDDTRTTTTKTPTPFVTREEWGANSPKAGIRMLERPIQRVIVAHTGGGSCSDLETCKSLVKSIQTEDPLLDDIPYNFLVGGDGRVYEGRGFSFEGQHTANIDATEYNSIGICVAFIGNYTTIEPSEEQMKAFREFLTLEEINDEFIVVLQDDLMYRKSRAAMLDNAIGNLEKYYPLQRTYRREEWNAREAKGNVGFDRTMNWVILSHTVTYECRSEESCASQMRLLQNTNMNNQSYADIGFHFYIGDGLVFEGRGWDWVGAHFKKYNYDSVGIAMIGDFSTTEPTQAMLDALKTLLNEGEALGKLTADYKVNGRQDIGEVGPGNAFMNHVRKWCRYGNRTVGNPCDNF